MDISKQVCTLEQSIRLFELGVGLNSQLAWCWNGAKRDKSGNKDFFVNLNGFYPTWPEAYCAFTVAELGVALGREISRQFYRGYSGKFNWEGCDISSSLHFDTQAQSYANQLIRGLQSEVFTATEVNERLKAA